MPEDNRAASLECVITIKKFEPSETFKNAGKMKIFSDIQRQRNRITLGPH